MIEYFNGLTPFTQMMVVLSTVVNMATIFHMIRKYWRKRK